jgi:ABC-type molybdate transport system substrate-binding protein
MIQTSLAKRIAMTAAGGSILCLLGATVDNAAEIKVLSSVALTSALNQIAPSFEQATGTNSTSAIVLSPTSESACWTAKPPT